MKKVMMVFCLMMVMVSVSFGEEAISETQASTITGEIDRVTIRNNEKITNTSMGGIFQYHIVYLKNMKVSGGGVSIGAWTKYHGGFLIKGDDKTLIASILSAKNMGETVTISLGSDAIVNSHGCEINEIVNLDF